MTTAAARKQFDAAIRATADPATIAKLEVCREYFTNAEFRAKLEDATFARTYDVTSLIA